MNFGILVCVHRAIPYLQVPLLIRCSGCTDCFVRSTVYQARREHPQQRLYCWCICMTETERLCHSTAGVGWRNAMPDTESGLMVILGTWNMRRETYCLRQRQAIC